MSTNSAYGDEMGNLTPWELFGEADARHAWGLAEEAVKLAQDIAQRLRPMGDARGA